MRSTKGKRQLAYNFIQSQLEQFHVSSLFNIGILSSAIPFRFFIILFAIHIIPLAYSFHSGQYREINTKTFTMQN